MSGAALAASRWPQLGPVDLVLVPLGSTEQHGPHLPFDTDTVIATAVAVEVAARLRRESTQAIVAPALAYGASGEHQAFPGTTSIGEDALSFVVVELARSVREWTQRVVFVNGHGGNVRALSAAVEQLREEGHDASWAPCAVPGADAHAGRTETSLMLHLAPETVALDRAQAGATAPVAELLPVLRTSGVRAVAPNGVLGDPTGASAAEGARLLATMADAVLRRIARGAEESFA